MTDRIVLAPLRGVTVRVFRNTIAKHFSGIDEAVAPFIATVAGEKVKPALLADIRPEENTAGFPLVPQVIGKDPAQLVTMIQAIRDLGYAAVDLNSGCPWPFVTKKGRGCGLLRDEKVFEAMVAAGSGACDFSVKVRLGLKTPDLLEKRMEILNRYPLREVCIHARTADQMYEGQVHLDAFARAAEACRHRVVYNGDIVSPDGYTRLKERFPQITRWMIGRGLSTNPFLAEMIKTGEDTRTPERLAAYLGEILEVNLESLCGEAGVIGRMKELWSYLRLGIRDGDRVWSQIKICRTVSEYDRVVKDAVRHFRGFA